MGRETRAGARAGIRGAALGVVLVLVSLLTAPAATADTSYPTPPNMSPIYGDPELDWLQKSGSVLTEEEALARKADIYRSQFADSPKWWARPVNLATASGALEAGGVALFGFGVGWQMGAGYLRMVHETAVATGVDLGVLDAWCAAPTWYQGTTLAYWASPVSDCPGMVVDFFEPNVDVDAIESITAPDGRTLTLVGTSGTQFCYASATTGSWPGTGYAYNQQRANGTWTGNGSLGSGTFCGGAGQYGTPMTSGGQSMTATLRVVTSPGGEVVSSWESTNPNPDRSVRCRYSFSDSPDQYSDPITYDAVTGFPAAAIAEVCEDYVNNLPQSQILTLTSIGVEESTEGGAYTEIADSPVESEADPNTSRKALTLWQVSTELNCLNAGWTCKDWWEQEQATPGTYRCQSGETVVDISKCRAYERSFNPEQQTNADVRTIQDPETGEQFDWGPGVDPSNSLNPGTGPGTGENPSQACLTSWPSVADPVSWVLHPIKCAFVWAGVPRQSKIDETQERMDSNWRASSIGQLGGAVSTALVVFDGLQAGDCGGLIIPAPTEMSATGQPVFHDVAILPACEGDFFEPWAPIFYWLISGTLVVGGVFAIKRQLDRFVGFS